MFVDTSLVLGGDTITDFVGSGLSLSTNVLGVNLTTSGTTGSTSSNSGLEVSASGLTLLKGCTDGELLKWTDGGGWACAVDTSGGMANYWQQNGGTVSPYSNTLDLLVGGTSTASAKFAFMNSLTGTPTASIAGTTTNVATYLTGNGNLATTNMAGLTLGGATTGNISLNPLNGAGTVDFNASVLDVNTQATDLDIKDNTASAFTISEGANNYFLLTTTNGAPVVTLDTLAAAP